jgi:hypothetical protein
MKPTSIQAAVSVIVLALLLVQCQSRDQDQDKQLFNASLNISFSKMPSESAVRFRNNQRLQKVVNTMVLPAVRAGDLKIYQTDSLQKRLSPDSLNKAGIEYQYFKFYTNWQVRSSEMYGFLDVRAIGYPSGRPDQLMYMQPESLNTLLDSSQKALLRKTFYQSVIERPLLNEKARSLVPAFKVNDHESVRLIPSNAEHPVFGAYVRKQFAPIHEKLLQTLKNGKLPVYESLGLNQKLKDSQRQKLIKNDTIKTPYRPKPVKKPRHVVDTVIRQPLEAHRFQSYIVLEQWQPIKGHLMDYQPTVKAVGPIVKYPSRLKILYWIKAEDFKQALTKSQHRWLRAYMLHTLKAEFSIGTSIE